MSYYALANLIFVGAIFIGIALTWLAPDEERVAQWLGGKLIAGGVVGMFGALVIRLREQRA